MNTPKNIAECVCTKMIWQELKERFQNLLYLPTNVSVNKSGECLFILRGTYLCVPGHVENGKYIVKDTAHVYDFWEYK